MRLVNLTITERWKQWLLPCCLCVLLLAGSYAFGNTTGDEAGVLRSRVYKLDHITSKQAQELFMQLNIGKSYNALSSDVLIVTSNIGSDLSKATEIINVLDQTPPAQIRSLMVISKNNPAPPLDAFFATLETISAGTMTDGPTKGANRPAVVDVLGDKLIAIGTEDVLKQIETAFENLQKEHPAEIPEEQSVAITPSEPLEEQPQTPNNKSKTQIQPTPPAEPNVLEDIESKTETIEAVKSETAEESAIGDEPQPSEQVPLAEIAQQVLESPMTTDVNDLPVESKEKSEEDFLSEGMFEELADAEQNVVVPDAKTEVPGESTQTESVVTEVQEKVISEDTSKTAAADQPSPQKEIPDALMEKLQALLKKPEDQQQQTSEKPKQAETTVTPEVTEQPEIPQTVEAVDETATLQAELAALRQRLAELETKTIEAKEPSVPLAAEKTKVILTDESESKVQTAKPVQTEPQIEAELAEEELETVIDLPQEVELEALIDLVGKQLGLNYMYDPVKLKGQKVQLKIHGGTIKVKDTYKLLESVLRFKGFVMTRRGQLVTILPQAELAKAEPVLRSADDPIQPGDVVVSSLFELKYINPTSAENMLKGMNLGTGFTRIEETGTLIVTDFAYQMERIRQVLDMIDVPGEEREYEFRTLKYMEPTEMLPKLQELAEQLQGVSLQINAPVAAAPAQRTRTVRKRDPKTGKMVTTQVPIRTPTPSPSTPQTSPQPDSVFIDTDDRTNRILMAGRQDQIDLINELIDALDVPQYDLKTVREYIIENVEAGEVVDVIEELALGSVSVTRDSMTSTRTTTSRRAVASRNQPRTPTPQPVPGSTETGESSQIYISIRAATNSLLVNATTEQHKALELVIAHVDVVQKDQRTIRQYEIQYIDTQEIITTLEELEIIAPQETGYDSYSRSRSSRDRDRLDRTSRSMASARNTNQPGTADIAPPLSLPSAAGGSEVDITADQPQISVLETTNSLLVYATPRQHDAIALVIAHADRQLDTTSTPYVVYALENQDPEELAGVLTELIQETIEEVQRQSSPTDKIQTRQGTGTTSTPKLPTLEEENIRVIADPMSYSLIVYANKRNQLWISELIRELDEYRPQVLLDCTLVEVTKDDLFKFEVDLVSKTYPDLTLRPGTSGNLGDLTTSIANLGGSTSFDPRTYAHAATGAGTFTGFLNSDMVQGLLTAMERDKYGRVMARPKILVNDNQEGQIKTENTISVAQVKSTTNIPESGAPVTSTDVSFNDYQAGVTLTIKPHISKGDMLRLEITLNRTDFTLKDPVEITNKDGNVEKYPSPPDRLSTDVETVSTVPDGTTIILGGLETIDQSKSTTKVPILGDLPLVGGLFRDVNDADEQGKLYVFVKANIIRPGDQIEGLEDIRRVSGKYRREFENMERKFQDLQEWPGIDSKEMQPTKVLEEDEVETKEISKDGYMVQDN